MLFAAGLGGSLRCPECPSRKPSEFGKSPENCNLHLSRPAEFYFFCRGRSQGHLQADGAEVGDPEVESGSAPNWSRQDLVGF